MKCKKNDNGNPTTLKDWNQMQQKKRKWESNKTKSLTWIATKNENRNPKKTKSLKWNERNLKWNATKTKMGIQKKHET